MNIIWQVEELKRQAMLASKPLAIDAHSMEEMCDFMLKQHNLLLAAQALVMALPEDEYENYDENVYNSESEFDNVEELEQGLIHYAREIE